MKWSLTHISLNLFLEGEKHIRDSVLPSKQPRNAFLSLPLAVRNRKIGKPGELHIFVIKDLLIGCINLSCLFGEKHLQGFAAIWHLTFWLHGDLEEENLANKEYKPCVYEIHDFTSTFLFSVETQHTIGTYLRERQQVYYISGYGSRGSTNKCWDTVVLQCIQSIVGVIIQVLDNLPTTNFARIDGVSGKLWHGLNGVRNLSRNGLVGLHLVLRAHSVVAAQ